MLAAVHTATLLGVQGQPVTVEALVSNGLPAFQMVGLPDESCRESRDRVRAAIVSSGLAWPTGRVIVNLAPSDQRKGGAGLDLAIAVALLVAQGVVPGEAVEGLGFVAELGLDGTLRPVPGVAPMVAALGDLEPVVAPASYVEARIVAPRRVRAARNVRELVDALCGDAPWPDPPDDVVVATDEALVPDLSDVRGQRLARRTLEVAAAGEHHLLLVGPPGSGKTMLAQRLPGLLPELTPRQAVETTMVHSAAGLRLPAQGLVRRPPFRAPHHSSSMVALVGGGTQALRPGEISMAANGVLFLDELGEFAPSVLDAMRQPLEEGVVRVARAKASAALPARFLLVAATNPCPCGGGAPGACECDDGARLRYLRRLSGPLLDRFDLRISVQRPEVDELLSSDDGERTAVVAARVARARMVARRRNGGVLNAALSGPALDEVAALDGRAQQMLRTELEAGRLTGRGYHRIRRVARTLADLDGDAGTTVAEPHVALALQLRVRLGISSRRPAA